MPIDVSTVYSKDRLLKYNFYVVKQKKVLWSVVMLTAVFAVIQFVFKHLDDDGKFYISLILIWDALVCFLYFVLPIFLVNKAKNKDIIVHYSFTENEIRSCFDNSLISEARVSKYETIVKLAKNGEDLYLFIDKKHAYLVDISTFDTEQLSKLKVALASKIPAKKFKWK